MQAVSSVLSRLAACVPLALAAMLPAAATVPAAAQDFYQGKTLSIVVGIDVGSGYDTYARLFARHIARHIAGQPTIIVQNMPGAASVKAAEYIYSIAPKDGTQIGIVFPNALVDPLTLEPDKRRYEPTRFEYLGTADSGTRVCFTYQTSKVRTMDDARRMKTIIAATTRGGPGWDYSMLMNALAGTKFEIITGYKAGPDQFLAMERGEAEGMCSLDVSSLRAIRPDWLGSAKANVFVQWGVETNPELATLGIPPIWNFIQPADRPIVELVVSQQVFQRPYIAAPGTPPARLAELRHAFMAAHKEPDLLAEAARMKLSINPKSGEDVAELVRKLYATPRAVVDRMTRIIRP